jgi:hypothetical protein
MLCARRALEQRVRTSRGLQEDQEGQEMLRISTHVRKIKGEVRHSSFLTFLIFL